MTLSQRAAKRLLDIVVALTGIVLTGWLMLLAAIAVRIETGSSGIYVQQRIGKNGESFGLIKIRTMYAASESEGSVTVANDPRVTRVGSFLRRFKIDELPQLINVLIGDMSLVGPRPDVPGFADRLQGDDRIVLSVRPGITGPATLKYRNEEQELAQVDDPGTYNLDVVYPDKVRINCEYIRDYRFMNDIRILLRTVRAL